MATYQFFFAFFLVSIVSCNIPTNTGYFDPLDPVQQSDFGSACFRRIYTLKIKQEDSQGRSCWDNVSVVSCWGRCASNEIADWRFPFKRSYHPVCQHEEVQPRQVILANCDPDVDSGTELYVALDAISCRCQLCQSEAMNCEGLQSERRLHSRRSLP